MFVVVRTRGTAQVRKTIEDTLNFLRLKNVNNCVIVPETKEYSGMLKKAKDYITWGNINKETLTNLIQNRCKVSGKKMDEKLLKEITGFETFEKISEALIKGKVRLKDYKQIKQVFKLNPPRHGFKGTRLPFPKGDLGNRKEKINELLERMI